MLSDEFPVMLAPAGLENFLKRSADGAFVRDSEMFVFFEFGIVASDDFVCWFEVHVFLRLSCGGQLCLKSPLNK